MILYLIPARRGSKGVPDKNLLRLTEGGPTLIERAKRIAIDAAVAEPEMGHVIVSTDYDDIDLGTITRKHTRPAELCKDETPMIDVVRYYLNEATIYYHIVVLLQPSSPFREVWQIQKAIELVRQGAPTCVAVTTPKTHPARLLTNDGLWPFAPLDPFVNRQELPEYFERVGTFYVANADHIRQGGDWYAPDSARVFVEPQYGINIDTPLDVVYAKAIAQECDL